MTLAVDGCGGTGGGGTVGAEAFGGGVAIVTVPTRMPASFSAAVATATVWPTKLGITKACGGGGSAESKLILGAEILLALGDGLCAIT